MGAESKKLLVSAMVFCWENPIVSLELLGVGTLLVMYPQPCFKTFLSPVVVCTAFFLSALLTLGHRQQHVKQQIILEEKGADDDVSLKFDGDGRTEEASDASDSMPASSTEMDNTAVHEVEAEETIVPSVLDKIVPANGDGSVEARQEPGRSANHAKSVHFGATQTLIFQQVSPSDSEIDEEFEDNLLLLRTSSATPDSDDEAAMRLSDSVTSPNNSVSDRSEEELDVRIDDFFSLTRQSSWTSFGRSNSSQITSSISDANSLGEFGPPLLYDRYQHHRYTSVDDEDDQSNSDEDESAVGLIGFSWTDQLKNGEDLFWLNVNAGDDDSQSMSEDDNLIEITPEYHDSEIQAIQTIQGCLQHLEEENNVGEYQSDYIKNNHGRLRRLQPKISNINSFIPEEDNLIEIDISGEKYLPTHEDERRSLDLESKESPRKLIHLQTDQMTPPLTHALKVNYALQIESMEEIMTECKYDAETIRQGYPHALR